MHHLAVEKLAILFIFLLLGFHGVRALGKFIRWRAVPRIDKYIAQNPQCKTRWGIRCVSCGSGSIKNWSLPGPNDIKRIFSCNHCGTDLYRR